MADIFDEVEEDWRTERLLGTARRAAPYVAALLVLGLLAVGGVQAWRWSRHRSDARVAADYLAAAQLADGFGAAPSDAQRQQGVAAFARVAAEGRAGYRTLARLREAGLLASSHQPGDGARAVALWDAIGADGDADRLLRQLATLLVVQHELGSADPAALQAKLAPLTAPDNPWHALALEAGALLSLRSGHPDAAHDTLKLLTTDGNAPEDLRNRATALLNQ